MSPEPSIVESYYDDSAEREWARLERHRTEFAVTMRALAEHLPAPPAAVLDVGGGPGRYAIALAAMGYSVTLLDLSSESLEFARGKAAEAGVELAGYLHVDARDLSAIPAESYDAVLLMGPLGHAGLAAGSSVGAYVNVVTLVVAARRRLGRIGGRALIVSAARTVLASIAVLAWCLLLGALWPARGGARADLAILLLAVAGGAAAFWMASALVRAPERESLAAILPGRRRR